jgi:hypothetical protein
MAVSPRAHPRRSSPWRHSKFAAFNSGGLHPPAMVGTQPSAEKLVARANGTIGVKAQCCTEIAFALPHALTQCIGEIMDGVGRPPHGTVEALRPYGTLGCRELTRHNHTNGDANTQPKNLLHTCFPFKKSSNKIRR